MKYRNEYHKRREAIRRQQAAASDKLTALQSECPHANVTRIPRHSSGYAEAGEYWYECHCDDCGFFWTEPQ